MQPLAKGTSLSLLCASERSGSTCAKKGFAWVNPKSVLLFILIFINKTPKNVELPVMQTVSDEDVLMSTAGFGRDC